METEVKEPAATAARKMFKYSRYVDVGDGAEECEHSRDGECEDPEHFHAWCRLPNQYQREDIRKKALAAKARKAREMSDPESDSSVVLDNELARIADPLFHRHLIDEMIAREWAEDFLEAQADVREREEFEHIDQDQEEHDRLKAAEGDLPEEEQSAEYRAILKHVGAYVEAVRARTEEIQAPKRAELEERSPEDLVKLVRQHRMEEESSAAFLDVFSPWMWFVGTFKVKPHQTLRRPYQPMWEEIGRRDRPEAGTMFGEAPEVIDALRAVFTDLSIALQRGSSGN